mmetsp:Transcript_35844/g.84956  ORF Transcript_35844/g.84956 Transcript_35844/m.84956 type:complete len:769 (-) Transcript_35844:132-2438(-)
MQGGKVADQVILEKSSATTLMRSFFEKLSGNKRDCVCAVDVISRLHNFMEAGNKKLKPDVEVGVRLMLALDDGCTRKLTYTEFVHFLLCFLHAYGERFSDLLPALIHSSPERDDSKLFCRYSLPAEVKGHAFSDGRLSCIYNVLEQRDGSAAGRLVLALKRFQPACAPAAVPCVRGDPLGPLSSCEQMSREKFLSMVAAITRSDSEKHQLADFISAYIACGDVLGFNAESVKILADISQAKTHSLAHMDGLRKIQLPRTWSDGRRGSESSLSPWECSKPRSCPAHGAKETPGVRSEMEDSFIAIPNFLHLNMQHDPDSQDKWPRRLAMSLPTSPQVQSPLRTSMDTASCQASSLATDSSSGSQDTDGGGEQYMDTFHFFGVFDGHGGAAAAVHCTKHLHKHLIAALSSDRKNDSDRGDSGVGDAESLCEQCASRQNSRLEVHGMKLVQGDCDTASPANADSPGSGTPSDGAPTSPGGKSCSCQGGPGFVERACRLYGGGAQESASDKCRRDGQAAADSSIGADPNACAAHQSAASLSGHYIEGTSTVSDLEQALTEAFLRTNAEFCETDDADHVGSTAVCCLIGSRQICVANCGDSRAIMWRNGGVIALTDDHKPDRQDERERVEEAGGQILYWNGRRVMGVLAMSRAIGDQSLKQYVIPDPEITIVQRREEDELLIMGSDGLWDVLSNEETCWLAKRALDKARSKGLGPRAAAKCAAGVLTRAALGKGSRDNITVIVVDLSSGHEDGRPVRGDAVCSGALCGSTLKS